MNDLDNYFSFVRKGKRKKKGEKGNTITQGKWRS